MRERNDERDDEDGYAKGRKVIQRKEGTEKKRRGRTYEPWSANESKAVMSFFMCDIKDGRVPGKALCSKCISQNDALLKKRSWQTVKDFVRNQIVKAKRLDH